MRITVEIDEETLRSVRNYTGEAKQSPAVARALTEYLKQMRCNEFLEKVLGGETDYSLSNEEVEEIAQFDDNR